MTELRLYSVSAVVSALGVFDDVTAEYVIATDMIRVTCTAAGRETILDVPNDDVVIALRDDQLELMVAAALVRHLLLEPDRLLVKFANQLAVARATVAELVGVIDSAGGYMKPEHQAVLRAARELA